MASLKRIRRQITALRQRIGAPDVSKRDLAKYATDPVGYARDVLQVDWWSKQREIVEKLQTPPYRVLVKASHSVGKSHLAAGLVNWWFDTHNPGICLTTAPTADHVRDVLWGEIRAQRRGRGGFPGPRMPRLDDMPPRPTHFAKGLTAAKSSSFQGYHGMAMLIIFDEAVGIANEYWNAARSMTMGQKHGWVCLCNPTDTTSRFYAEEQLGGWHVVHIPCIEHPNIAAELAGEPPPYPSAVRLEWFKERLKEWSRPVVGEVRPTDLEWPPKSGKFVRPSPDAEARLLGRWPSQTTGVWSDALWASCEVQGRLRINDRLQIGCDVARAGDDATAFHVRFGGVSLMHEEVYGFKTNETAGRLKELCNAWCGWWNKHVRERRFKKMHPEEVLCTIDDDGVGGGVTDNAGDYSFYGVSAARVAMEQQRYPNTRSELWFALAGRAERGELAVGRLPPEVRLMLRIQAMSPAWKLDAAGRRLVDPKDKIKAEVGRSPDGMDAMNLAYYEPGGTEGVTAVKTKKPRRASQPKEQSEERPRGEAKPRNRRHWK